MGVTHFFQGLQPFERRLIYISVVGIFICLYLLRFHNFSENHKQKMEKEIGYLAEAQADIRIKNFARTLWESAQKNQSVREGDKIYTGEKSSAIITLKNDSRIELKSNSLVEFKKIRNQNIADLSEGQYRVAVSKDIKVSINGQIAKIEGTSEVILNIDKNKKVSIQTLQGAPKVQFQAKTYTPTVSAPVEIEPEAPQQDIPNVPQQKRVALQIRNNTPTFNYIFKLYDKYERVGQELKDKENPSQLVNVSIALPIETYDSSKDISIELSTNAEQTSTVKYDIDPFEHTLPQAYIGENYWRASQEKDSWSEVSRFTVVGTTLPQSTLNSKWSSTKLVLKKGAAEADVELSTEMAANGYLISSSRQEVFNTTAITYWSYQNKIHLLFTRPGLYYYRFRAVDESLQLGQWSNITTIEVIEPPTLAAPQFAMKEYKATAGESLLLSWMTPDPYKNYRVKIYTTSEDKIIERVVTDPFLHWTPKNAGDYYAEVTTLGPYKQISEPGRASILVKAMEIRLSNDTEDDKNKEQDRDVASQVADDPNLQVKAEYPTVHLGYNADFVLSRATFSTNYYDGFNSKALADNHVLPVQTPGVQLATLGWFDHHGGEAIIQKNLTSNEPGSADFYSAEVRYHYRFYSKDEQPGSVGFHISPFIGYEMFSNSNSTNFLADYNLMKLGFFMEVPIMQSWAMGLTGGYGSGDSLSKYEALWDVSYYFKKQWTMGFGLKTNLIFGTNSQFPNYPDYREGYSLGQFNLRYFF